MTQRAALEGSPRLGKLLTRVDFFLFTDLMEGAHIGTPKDTHAPTPARASVSVGVRAGTESGSCRDPLAAVRSAGGGTVGDAAMLFRIPCYGEMTDYHSCRGEGRRFTSTFPVFCSTLQVSVGG